MKEYRLLERNPVSDISRKREPRGRTRFLTDEERAALLEACGKSEWPALYTLVLLAITTGARKGELIRLTWSDIDLKNGRALVRETKNDEQRTLPLAGKALDALRELKLQNSARSEWVFAQPSGLPGPYEHFDAHWYAALEAAGISDFHFHDLRHTTASMLAALGRLAARDCRRPWTQDARHGQALFASRGGPQSQGHRENGHGEGAVRSRGDSAAGPAGRT